jgi:hypothetical protein
LTRMRGKTYLAGLISMWPLMACAHTNDGSLAIFGTGAAAVVLGAVASARFADASTKYWIVGGGLFLVWLILGCTAGGSSSFIEKMFRMILFMIVLTPIPFGAAFAIGMLLRHLCKGESAKNDDA